MKRIHQEADIRTAHLFDEPHRVLDRVDEVGFETVEGLDGQLNVRFFEQRGQLLVKIDAPFPLFLVAPTAGQITHRRIRGTGDQLRPDLGRGADHPFPVFDCFSAYGFVVADGVLARRVDRAEGAFEAELIERFLERFEGNVRCAEYRYFDDVHPGILDRLHGDRIIDRPGPDHRVDAEFHPTSSRTTVRKIARLTRLFRQPIMARP